jgi:hypothetical protein
MMTKNEKRKSGCLRWWLIFATVLSIIIIFGTNSWMFYQLWDFASKTLFPGKAFNAMSILIRMSIAQIVILTLSLFLTWIFFKHSKITLSIIFSFAALAISSLPSFAFFIYLSTVNLRYF